MGPFTKVRHWGWGKGQKKIEWNTCTSEPQTNTIFFFLLDSLILCLFLNRYTYSLYSTLWKYLSLQPVASASASNRCQMAYMRKGKRRGCSSYDGAKAIQPSDAAFSVTEKVEVMSPFCITPSFSPFLNFSFLFLLPFHFPSLPLSALALSSSECGANRSLSKKRKKHPNTPSTTKSPTKGKKEGRQVVQRHTSVYISIDIDRYRYISVSYLPFHLFLFVNASPSTLLKSLFSTSTDSLHFTHDLQLHEQDHHHQHRHRPLYSYIQKIK